MNKIFYILLLLISAFAFAQDCEISCEDLEDTCGFVKTSDDADADPLNEIQTLSQNGTTITLSNGGGTVTVSGADDQILTYDANTKRLTIEDGNFVDLSQMPTWTTIAAPTVVGSGSYTTNLVQVLETDTYWYTQQDGDCREVYEFHFRIRGVHTATGGWGILTMSTIAGWDYHIFDVGTYRQSGNTNNPNNATQGAMPDAPYMGAEAHNWSNSTRIYLNQSNTRDNDSTIWVEFTVRFRRN